MSKNSKTDFKVLVKSKDNAVSARKELARAINPENEHCFDEANLDFINRQDYITAVPVEIALTVPDRKVILEQNPDLQFIITGVTANAAASLVDKYGYGIIEPEEEEPESVEDSANPSSSEKENLSNTDTIEFEGKTYTVEEIGDILHKHEVAKKQVNEMKKRFDADPFFKNFFKNGLFQYNIF